MSEQVAAPGHDDSSPGHGLPPTPDDSTGAAPGRTRGPRPGPERGPGPEAGPGPGGPPPHPGTLPDVWIYKGRAYDLTDWITKHPGGEFFIGRTKNRDITSVIASYHANPDAVEKMLQRYALDRDVEPSDIHPTNNAPPFLFKPGFDSRRDTPEYDFDRKDDLLHQVKKRLRGKEMRKRLARRDRLFDITAAILVVLYFGVQGLRLYDTSWMPMPAFVIAMVVLRSSLAGFGHYAVHRAQRGWNKFATNVFDLNYVALSFVTTDGHALLHHPYTQSEVDIKRNVFTAMEDLPRWYRVPVHTAHKLGHVVSGMSLRMVDVTRLTRRVGFAETYGSFRRALPHFLGAYAVRILLVAELIAFVVAGDFLAWFLQFAITVWVSTFLIVSSHDFEDDVHETVTDDWAVDQLDKCYDLSLVGNRHIDCFLSAGLSEHRVHHVLPYQRSGWANIATEDIVREEAAEFGVEWVPTKNFFLDRLPHLCKIYLLSPSRPAQNNNWGVFREHLSPIAFTSCLRYAAEGFTGSTV